LNRLQEMMNLYQFKIEYKEGSKNVIADALSRHLEQEEVSEAQYSTNQELMRKLIQQQETDQFCRAVKAFLQTGKKPEHADMSRVISKFAKQFEIRRDALYIWREAPGQLRKALIVLPKDMRYEAIRAAHASQYAAHGGQQKTLFRLQEQYWWPKMAAQVVDFIQLCPVCAAVKDPVRFQREREPLANYEIPDSPGIRVHADLMQVKKASTAGNKYILVITDAFSKWVELVPLPSKDAVTVASAIYTRWICRYGCFKQLVTDRGREFCNSVLDGLAQLLGIRHSRTAALHPQTNSQSESFNRTCWKMLASMVENPDTDDWEMYLPPVMLAYNTAVHRATMMSPFFLTFLHDANLPYFDLDKPQVMYGENWATDAFKRMQICRKLAQESMRSAQILQKQHYDQGTKHFAFQVGETVWVKFPRSTLSVKNSKFAKTWFQHVVEKIISPTTYALRRILPTKQLGPRTIVHRNRIKADNTSVRSTNFSTQSTTTNRQTQARQIPHSEEDEAPGAYISFVPAQPEADEPEPELQPEAAALPPPTAATPPASPAAAAPPTPPAAAAAPATSPAAAAPPTPPAASSSWTGLFSRYLQPAAPAAPPAQPSALGAGLRATRQRTGGPIQVPPEVWNIPRVPREYKPRGAKR